jgi:hypothetical protein
MVYVIQVCRQLSSSSSSSRIRMFQDGTYILIQDVPGWNIHPDPARMYPFLRVQWITPDDGQRDCPKHVEFHFQNKFEELVHLVGFIVRHYKVFGVLVSVSSYTRSKVLVLPIFRYTCWQSSLNFLSHNFDKFMFMLHIGRVCLFLWIHVLVAHNTILSFWFHISISS